MAYLTWLCVQLQVASGALNAPPVEEGVYDGAE
jgi:hypothetical protein